MSYHVLRGVFAAILVLCVQTTDTCIRARIDLHSLELWLTVKNVL